MDAMLANMMERLWIAEHYVSAVRSNPNMVDYETLMSTLRHLVAAGEDAESTVEAVINVREVARAAAEAAAASVPAVPSTADLAMYRFINTPKLGRIMPSIAATEEAPPSMGTPPATPTSPLYVPTEPRAQSHAEDTDLAAILNDDDSSEEEWVIRRSAGWLRDQEMFDAAVAERSESPLLYSGAPVTHSSDKKST